MPKTRGPLEMVDALFHAIEREGEVSLSTLQRSLRTNYESLKTYVELAQRIQAKPRIHLEGNRVKLTGDWIDPHIRAQIGYTPSVEDLLFIKLLDRKATTPENALPIAQLDKQELSLLNELVQAEQMKITSGLKVHLTEMGTIVAQGAKKAYRL